MRSSSVAGVDPMALGLVELVHVVRACAVARLLDVVPVSAAFDAFDDVACMVLAPSGGPLFFLFDRLVKRSVTGQSGFRH